MNNQRRRISWLGDALLPRTSPVVPWNDKTIYIARGIGPRLEAAKLDNARFADRLGALSAEMEAAWHGTPIDIAKS